MCAWGRGGNNPRTKTPGAPCPSRGCGAASGSRLLRDELYSSPSRCGAAGRSSLLAPPCPRLVRSPFTDGEVMLPAHFPSLGRGSRRCKPRHCGRVQSTPACSTQGSEGQGVGGGRKCEPQACSLPLMEVPPCPRGCPAAVFEGLRMDPYGEAPNLHQTLLPSLPL